MYGQKLITKLNQSLKYCTNIHYYRDNNWILWGKTTLVINIIVTKIWQKNYHNYIVS